MRSKSNSWRGMSAALLLSVSLGVIAPTARTQSSGGDFEITRSTIDGGGGSSTGGDFLLSGTIAQPDASIQTASGGTYKLTGGFWANGEIIDSNNFLFADGFE